MSGFAAKILKQSALVHAIEWYDTNNVRFYLILEVEKSKYQLFNQQIESGEKYNPAEFGTILYSGVGEPDDALKAELREKYGMYEDDSNS